MPAVEWFEGFRDELADLFALADDSPVAVRAAMAERVYAAVGFRDLGRILEYVP